MFYLHPWNHLHLGIVLLLAADKSLLDLDLGKKLGLKVSKSVKASRIRGRCPRF